MSSEDIYQSMAERLAEVLPDDWENVILYGEYGTASYSMDCYIDCGDGKFTQCFEMESVSEDKVLEAFSDINVMIRNCLLYTSLAPCFVWRNASTKGQKYTPRWRERESFFWNG